jgi:ubiquinone/menaquinone biosynthesis C-methylase UbiE
MGLYTQYVLPRVMDLALRNKDMARLRASWIPQARGQVLEIGIGTGLNLPFYNADVTRLYGVEPSPEFLQIARQRASTLPIRVEFLLQSAEQPLPLAQECIDTVVVTWTLCSIPDVFKALAQARRVLKPEGRVIFLEHGRSADDNIVAWQDRMTPVWRRIGGGCHLNRPIDRLITEAGFHITELHTGYLAGPRPMTYTYQGTARL